MKKKIVAFIAALGLCFSMTTTAFATEGTGDAVQTAEDRLTTDKTSYEPGEPIMVTAVGEGKDWIGVSVEGASGYMYWWYVESIGSGTPVDINALIAADENLYLANGRTYELRLIPNDGGWDSEDVVAKTTFSVLPKPEETPTTSLEESLIAHYDAQDNANGSHDAAANVWKDLSGKGNDYTLDGDGYVWSDKALQVQGDKVGDFPTSVVDVTNSGVFTFEIALGAFESTAYEYDTIVSSANDAFSIFHRVGSDILEFKYNDGNGDENRVQLENGVDGMTDSTITYVVNCNREIVKMYVDGELIDEGMLKKIGNEADNLTLGHNHGDRKWNGDVYSIRVYDRALTEDEVKQNVAEIDAKYRTVATPEPTEEPTEEPTPTPTKTPEKPADEKDNNNTVVIVIAVIAVVAIVGGAVYVISKKKNK